jgi:3-(methylthio)propionyl---CoA ligase
MQHPAVLQAAAIGVPDEKWGERAVLVVAPQPGSHVEEADILALYKGRVAKWSVPEGIIVVDALPVGATGKVQKNKLRQIHCGGTPGR